MFSIVTVGSRQNDDESTTIVFKHDSVELSFSPEYLVAVNEIKANTFNSHPSNGEFKFTWDDEKVTFTAARHGDGRGGELCITLPFTTSPGMKQSLLDCITSVQHQLRQEK